MDEKHFDNPQEKQLTPEEQLDLLLEQFKDDPVAQTPSTDVAEVTEKATAMPSTEPLEEAASTELPEETPVEMPALEELTTEGQANEIATTKTPSEIPELMSLLDTDSNESPESEAEASSEDPLDDPAEVTKSPVDGNSESDSATEGEMAVLDGDVEAEIPAAAMDEADDAPADAAQAQECIITEIAKEHSNESSDEGEEVERTPTEEASSPATEENPENKTDSTSTDAEDEKDNAADEDVDGDDEEDTTPLKKRRPKNNKAYGFFGIPHILATFIWLGIIVFIGVGLGKLLWNCASDILALGRPDSVVTITITEEDDLDSIADKLKTTGLIKYASLFKLYGQISDAMDSIRTGTFQLNTLFDYHALVDAMSSNQRRVTINVTIPEGYTMSQTFELLEYYGVSTVDTLKEAAATGELGEYWFLEGVDRSTDNCLEGYLFPDTYTFYLDHNPVGVLQKFLDNFNKRFNDVMKLKLDTLNATLADMMRKNGLSEEYIAQHQLTVRDVVIIASMIEKETSSNPESYTISSVIYNRLTNPNEYPYLNIDATLVYYKGGGQLTAEDLTTDHPYNTYTRPGLVPGPISNPGGFSLAAALEPEQTAYYFYALNPSTGEHHFSKTLREHEQFLESIRQQQEPEEEPTQ